MKIMDVNEAVALSKAKKILGTLVTNVVEGSDVPLRGIVIGYFPNEGLYHVNYDNGDTANVHEDDIFQILNLNGRKARRGRLPSPRRRSTGALTPVRKNHIPRIVHSAKSKSTKQLRHVAPVDRSRDSDSEEKISELIDELVHSHNGRFVLKGDDMALIQETQTVDSSIDIPCHPTPEGQQIEVSMVIRSELQSDSNKELARKSCLEDVSNIHVGNSDNIQEIANNVHDINSLTIGSSSVSLKPIDETSDAKGPEHIGKPHQLDYEAKGSGKKRMCSVKNEKSSKKHKKDRHDVEIEESSDELISIENINQCYAIIQRSLRSMYTREYNASSNAVPQLWDTRLKPKIAIEQFIKAGGNIDVANLLNHLRSKEKPNGMKILVLLKILYVLPVWMEKQTLKESRLCQYIKRVHKEPLDIPSKQLKELIAEFAWILEQNIVRNLASVVDNRLKDDKKASGTKSHCAASSTMISQSANSSLAALSTALSESVENATSKSPRVSLSLPLSRRFTPQSSPTEAGRSDVHVPRSGTPHSSPHSHSHIAHSSSIANIWSHSVKDKAKPKVKQGLKPDWMLRSEKAEKERFRCP